MFRNDATRNWVAGFVGIGAGLVALGELAALSAMMSLRFTPLPSLDQALIVQDTGLIVALVGYAVICAGLVIHGRASE